MSGSKFWSIDHAPVVGIVGNDPATGELASTVSGSDALQVERLDPDDIPERLHRTPPVEVLWIGSVEGSTCSVIEAAASADPVTRIVAVLDGVDAPAATRAGATRCVEAGSDVDACVDAIEEVLDRALTRRGEAVKGSVLDTMLTDLGLQVYVKDDQARHVLYAEVENAPDPEDVFGLTDVEAYPTYPEHARETYEDDLRVIEEGQRTIADVEELPNDDAMLTWKVPWMEGDDPRGLVGATINVTEFKDRERELLQQIARLQQIPDYVNHDLRSPLTIAQGYLDLARSGEDTLDEVEESLDRLEDMLEDFHAMATRELETGAARRPVRLATAVEEVWTYLSAGRAELEVSIPRDTWIVADESQLRPLLKNLLGNAVTHAGPEVTVRVGVLANEGSADSSPPYDGFFVADDGPGIPPGDRAEIFDQGYSTATDGTGLGLAIVGEVASLHGWETQVSESDEGGAQFELRNCLLGRPPRPRALGEAVSISESIDVGDPAVPGEMRRDGDAYVVTGAGENIWGGINEFHFAHAPVDGDVRVQAQVAGAEQASQWSKAGVMVRSDLAESGAYGLLASIADRMPEVGWRETNGAQGHAHQLEGLGPDHCWVRIDRVGDRLTCSLSVDGDEWTFVDRRSVDLAETVYVGLAVCSVEPTRAIEARFEDVSVRRLDPA